MPLLSTYLGHVDPASTYWYLEAVPELLELISRRLEQLPEVLVMTALAPALQAFFTERLITQRNASPQTIAAYRDTFRLLLGFAHEQTGKQPFELDIDDLDAPLIGAFLTHLEHDRGNSPRTRNARLGGDPLVLPLRRARTPRARAHDRAGDGDPDQAPRAQHRLLPRPRRDQGAARRARPATWLGRRDHALLLLMIQTGVRVSELVGLRVGDVHLGTGAHIRVTGKGRKKRATTLTGETVAILLRAWLTERRGQPDDPLFPTRQGRPLSRYTVGAAGRQARRHRSGQLPVAEGQTRHPARAAPHQRDAPRAKGVDIATIALWLGHESTQTTHIYEHADPALKEQAIARTAPLGAKPGRYRPSDTLLAFLEGL